MASGSYAQGYQGIKYREAPHIRQKKAERPVLAPTTRRRLPWLIYPTGALCVFLIVLGAEVLSPHQSAPVLTSGQSYDMQGRQTPAVIANAARSTITPINARTASQTLVRINQT